MESLAQIGFVKILVIALLSMVPTFEGRYALTAGIAAGMPVWFTFALAFVFSTIPMFFLFWLLKPILRWLYELPLKPRSAFWKKTPLLRRVYKNTVSLLHRFAEWVHTRSMKKARSVDAKGLLGLFLFVALPVPGTGVWTGTAIATLLEMNRRHSMLAIVAGNLCACVIMLLLTTGVLRLFA